MSDWNLILVQAKKCFEADVSWKSFVRDRVYKIESVDEEKIVIQKVSGGLSVKLTERIVNTALSKVQGKTKFHRNDLPNSVSRDATIIFLHPNYYWDRNTRVVFKVNVAIDLNEITSSIQQADDDEINRIWKLVNQRKQQSKFRKSLPINYQRTCPITRCQIIDILDAAHIFDHAKSWINKLDNGILLRKDLHGLFDCGKLAIEPATYKISIHPDLKNSEYWIYNNHKIDFSLADIKPAKAYLTKKWDSYNWTKKVQR